MNQTSTISTATDIQTPADAQSEALTRLREIAYTLKQKPFRPHPLFANGHAQTLAAFAWPRRRSLSTARQDEARTFEVEPGVRVLVHCRWQRERRAQPALLVVHGLEGSSESKHVLGTAEKAYRAGFNALRLNLRTCGDTQHLTPTLYHSGMTHDLLAVIRELIARDGLTEIFLGGYSLGGNMSLKLAGDEGAGLPREVRAVFAVSPPIDLAACAEAIRWRSNWLYQYDFMRRLRRRLRIANKLYPDRYDLRDLHKVRTIREFDARFTAPVGGFRDVDDYYARASALPRIPDISRPALIIHAQDDPFIPFASFRDPRLTTNPFVVLLTPQYGGHVGFVAAKSTQEDRFWAENRVVEFCRMVKEMQNDE
jgi:predicted alpha/beta-fold hydrolase